MDNGALAEAALDEDEMEANLCSSFPACFLMPKVGISSSHYASTSIRSQTSWQKVRFGSLAGVQIRDVHLSPKSGRAQRRINV
jgi:hypothetical protein